MTAEVADMITFEKKRGKPTKSKRLEKVAAVESVQYEDVIFGRDVSEHAIWGKKLEEAREFCRKVRAREADYLENINYASYYQLPHLMTEPYWGEFSAVFFFRCFPVIMM
jgi:hypothetical protein